MKPNRQWLSKGALLALGVGVLFVVLLRADLQVVLHHMRRVGWMFVPAFLSYGGMIVLSARSWQEMVDRGDSDVRTRDALLAYWCGTAVNEMAPTGAFGEVLKGTLLRPRAAGREIVASLVIYNYLSGVVMLLWSMIGLVISVLALALPRVVLLSALAVAGVVLIVLIVLGVLLRHGLLGMVARFGAKLPLVKIDREKLERHARVADDRISSYHAQRPRSFWRAVSLLVGARLMEVLEVVFLVWALVPEPDIGWLLLFSLFIQTATQFIKYAMIFIPGQIGVLEAGSAALFGIAGASPSAGLAMELLRRLRRILAFALALPVMMSAPTGRYRGRPPSLGLPDDTENERRWHR